MWFNGFQAEIAVRCSHCGDRDWRTPEELKNGRMVCFKCGRVSLHTPAMPRRGAAG